MSAHRARNRVGGAAGALVGCREIGAGNEGVGMVGPEPHVELFQRRLIEGHGLRVRPAARNALARLVRMARRPR